MFSARRGTSMTPLASLCAFALLAAAPEGGIISITTTSSEAAADYVEAFDQLFAGHGDLARAAAKKALSRDPNLLLAQALLYAITPGTESMQKVDAAAQAGASLPEAERAAQADYAYALITAGNLGEAERTARRAAALPNADAKPVAALANVEYYRSQYAPAHRDLAKARSLSKDDNERMGLMLFELLGYTAEGKYQGAMQAASALEKEARARKNPNFYVVAAMNRSFAANLLGKYGEGQKHAAEALARTDKEPLSDAGRKGLKRGTWIAAMWAQGFGKNIAEAQKTLAMLEKDAAESPNDLNAQSAMWWGRGVLKLVNGDAKSAAEEMQKCVPTFDLCHFHQAIAQEKAGDKAGAQATRATLLAQQRSQDAFFLSLRSQLRKKQVRTAAAGPAAVNRRAN